MYHISIPYYLYKCYYYTTLQEQNRVYTNMGVRRRSKNPQMCMNLKISLNLSPLKSTHNECILFGNQFSPPLILQKHFVWDRFKIWGGGAGRDTKSALKRLNPTGKLKVLKMVKLPTKEEDIAGGVGEIWRYLRACFIMYSAYKCTLGPEIRQNTVSLPTLVGKISGF